jgi:hypothetical protein
MKVARPRRKWQNSASTIARAKVPGVASQVPVSTAPSGAAHASTLPIVGRGRPPTGGGIKTSNALGAKSDGRSMCTIVIEVHL